MSLNQWSLIYFGISVLYFTCMLISLFSSLTFQKIIVVAIAFLAQCGVLFFYGISTNQTGLVLVSLLQIFVVALMFIYYGRLFNENKDS